MKKNGLGRGFVFAALLLLTVSIALNIFLYSQLRKYYTLLYSVSLDPLGLPAFQTVYPEEYDEDVPTVVFYGDSRAAQWVNPTIDGFTFLNRGIGNQTTAQVLNRFEAHILPLRPDIVIIQVGINDLKTLPLFPERKTEIIADCKANIQKMIDEALRLNAQVILSTIFPTGEVPLQRRLVWSDDIEEGRVEVNSFIRSLAADKVIIFDADEILADSSGQLMPDYRYDELHLNQSGYEILNLELNIVLEQFKKDF